MRRHQEFNKTEISGATIRSTSKRRTAMLILMFLDQENMPHTITETAEALDMDQGTAKHNLLELMECKFLEIVEDKMDSRTRYFQVGNKEATEKAFKLYKRWVSYRLGRLIPYDKIHSEKLKSDNRFIEECKFYGLKLYEGINAVASCPKIGTQTADYSRKNKGLVLWRKREG